MTFDIKKLVRKNRIDGALPISPATRALNPDIDFDYLHSELRKTKNGDKKDLFLQAWQEHAPNEILPETEHRFAKPRKFAFDFAFIDHKIAIEIDGGNFMVRRNRRGQVVPVGRHTQESDYEKLNFAASLGWLVFRFTPRMLAQNPRECIELVKKAIS